MTIQRNGPRSKLRLGTNVAHAPGLRNLHAVAESGLRESVTTVQIDEQAFVAAESQFKRGERHICIVSGDGSGLACRLHSNSRAEACKAGNQRNKASHFIGFLPLEDLQGRTPAVKLRDLD